MISDKVKYRYILFFVVSTLTSCGGSDGSGSDDMPTDDNPTVVLEPVATTLIFPEDNTECNQGEILNETQSTVVFRWNESENTDNYQVNVVNLNSTIVLRVNVAENEAPITIERGIPYEWFVISQNNNTNVTATSQKFRFYNEGPGIENYAPFPAKAIHPKRGQSLLRSTRLVTLEWESSDIDQDILEYEVFFDTADNPASLGKVQQPIYTNLEVNSGSQYFWKITAFDSAGNSTESELFSFRVD